MKTETIITQRDLIAGLKKAGVREGMIIIVHSSLQSFGAYICGGATAVLLALEHSVGTKGTIVMPAQSSSLSEPRYWKNPPVPESWWQIIRNEAPAFDAYLTPSSGIGKIAETFRAQQNTLRSGHPMMSFTARGTHAQYLTDNHSLELSLGEGSPLAKLYELGGYILMLGAPLDNNTTLHLAEIRADFPNKPYIKQGSPIQQNGIRTWVEYDDLDYEDEDFGAIANAYMNSSQNYGHTQIAAAPVYLFPVRELVDYAVIWLERYQNTTEKE